MCSCLVKAPMVKATVVACTIVHKSIEVSTIKKDLSRTEKT